MSLVIPVSYGGNPCYEIHLEREFQSLLPCIQGLGYQPGRKACIISDSNVAPLYLEEVSSLLAAHFSCTSFVFEAGEASKHTGTVGQVYEHLIRHQFDRKDLLIALGGGVVGDLTGFAAATYLRGIDFIQIPTSLLAQVDSSIGGKTGVDFLQYKNMVGAFYMPRLVYMNLSVLHSLPEEHLASGMGEIIKHGQIKDPGYFQWLTEHQDAILSRELGALEQMVSGSCRIKGDVVQRDPKEQGERALLNFGHTIGHAIEKLSDFSLLHGECVALGMAAAAELSCRYGSYAPSDLEQLQKTIAAFGLPVNLKEAFQKLPLPEASAQLPFTPEQVLAATKLDKKMDGGRVKFILLKRAGEAYITRDLTDAQILEGIRCLF